MILGFLCFWISYLMFFEIENTVGYASKPTFEFAKCVSQFATDVVVSYVSKFPH